MKVGSRTSRVTVPLVLFVLSCLTLPASGAGTQKFTGEVSDAMCGRKHMEGPAPECTRTCVQHGSKYALVVGEKLYILETSDQSALAELDKQAGKNVTVTGTPKGDTIEVSSVVAAK